MDSELLSVMRLEGHCTFSHSRNTSSLHFFSRPVLTANGIRYFIRNFFRNISFREHSPLLYGNWKFKSSTIPPRFYWLFPYEFLLFIILQDTVRLIHILRWLFKHLRRTSWKTLDLPSYSIRMYLTFPLGRVAWRHTLGRGNVNIHGILSRSAMVLQEVPEMH